ncbi:hypothetical protein V8E55_008866 [Tylopilus felleus]
MYNPKIQGHISLSTRSIALELASTSQLIVQGCLHRVIEQPWIRNQLQGANFHSGKSSPFLINESRFDPRDGFPDSLRSLEMVGEWAHAVQVFSAHACKLGPRTFGVDVLSSDPILWSEQDNHGKWPDQAMFIRCVL